MNRMLRLSITGLFSIVMSTSALPAQDAPLATAAENVEASAPAKVTRQLSADQLKAGGLKACVQPSYEAWDQIQIGMTVEEVRKLLGEPLEDHAPAPRITKAKQSKKSKNRKKDATDKKRSDKASGETTILVGRLVYGKVEFDAAEMPHPFHFTLLHSDGVVIEKKTPFLAALIPSGEASTPVLISPVFNARIFPGQEIVDLRWAPSCGVYPMHYEVQVQKFLGHDDSSWSERQDETNYQSIATFDDLTAPHASVTLHPGLNRWRIRAKNELGMSEWSEWREYRPMNLDRPKAMLVEQIPAILELE